ncbi:MAG: bifunctional metallophosphatase/5'-nucleotidase [Bacteroidota bacterium]
MNKLLTIQALLIVALSISFVSCNEQEEESVIYIFASTDVHGAIFDTDPLTGRKSYSSMANIASYIENFERDEYILLDNGDNLQGSPAVYYYNFVDTSSVHLWARVLNYLDYDAATVGNHDIEAGHQVYDRIRDEYDFPLLAANAVVEGTGNPYFTPYTIIEKGGLKVAVMGLITPGVPGWLPGILYEGIEFRDMVETAEKWMPEIEKENPDLVVGLFHAGWDESYEGEEGSYMNNNASLAVAKKVEGFDIVIIGHDHDTLNEFVISEAGDSVLILDAGSRAGYLGVAELVLEGKRKKRIVSISGELLNMNSQEASGSFMEHFDEEYGLIKDYVSRTIGHLDKRITTREAYFGDSGFMDLIHRVQLQISGADISFAAPLSYDVTLEEGQVTVSDMFDLYRYENMLYTMEMKGDEIDRYLEYSYAQWFDTMTGPGDNLFKTEVTDRAYTFSNRTYNFDSAAGIDYTVDVSKPDGNKINIRAFSDGRPFEADKKYRVALNSYRGSGGGGHLEHACSLENDELDSRLLESTDKDLRYYMIKWFEENEDPVIETDSNWYIIPGEWIALSKTREYEKLFKETTNDE